MKAMLKKAFRPCISLLLVACLMLGLCSNGLIALAEGRKGGSTNVPTQKPVINYVSLGDSMTNGYGLPGYDMDSGVADYGDGSYANLFAAWLKEAGYADKVNHAQLAMSGLRAEDLHWLLELDYENADAISLTDGEWNEEAWNAMFTTGDYWTWNEICTHSRTHSTVQAILATGYDAFPSTYVDEENGEVALIAKYFQESVKNADIISLGIGNGDFGVFMMGRLMEAMEFGGADAADALVYEVENAIRELDPAMQKQVKVLIDQMYASLEQMIAGKTLPVAEEQKDALLNTAVYTSISFLLGYMGTLEAILKLNPDAQIIQVALMNTLGNEKVAGDVTLGELMSSVYNYLNTYIAGLPAAAQTVGLKAYAKAEFYYAEAAEVQCIVDVFGELVADEDSVIRDRFVENIVGTESNPGMIWGLLMESVELPGGYSLKFVTLEQIKNFEAMTLAQRADYTADEATAEIAVSCAIYLGVEQAILGSADEPVTLGTMAGLGNLGSAFGSIAGAFQGEAVYSDAVREAAASAIANKINAMAKDENPDANVNVTAQQILDLYADQSDANLLNFAFVLAGAIGGVPADMLEKIYNGTEITMDDAYEAIANETVKILKDEYGVEVEITAQTVKDVYERNPGHNATVLDLTCELVAAAASDALGLTITPDEVKAIHGGNHAVTMDLAFRVVANEAGIDGLTADMVRDLYDDNKLAVLELFFDMAAEDESNQYGLTAEDFEALYNGTVNAHIMDVIFGNADVEDMDEATLRALYDGDADVALQVIIDKLVEEGADREILEAVLVEGRDARTVIVEQIVAEGELTEQQVNDLLDGTVSAFELALNMIAEEEGTTWGALLDAYDNDPEVKEAVDTLASELNNLKADAEQAIDDLNEAAAEKANNINTLIADVQDAIDDAIVDLQNEIQNQVDTNYDDLRNELVDKLDNDVVPQINTEVVNGVNDAMEQIYDNVDNAVETARDTLEQDAAELQQQVREQVDGLVDAIRNALPQMDNLCLALNLPETLSDAMLADETVAGLLSMYGRCMLANGVGCHPSAGGHEDLFRAVKYAYVNGYTTQDEIIDKIDFINKYILSFGQEIDAILNENLAQVVKELKADLAKLYADLETEALALDAELDRLSREELALLKQLNADRAVLVEELVALQARLAELENGQNARTSATNSKSPETLAQELKAAIAETEAAIAELDAAIAALKAQIEADMQGIASIQASIAAIKAEILDTEAALAEVEAAIAQLNADLKVLYDATLVLADAAYNVYGLTLAHVDVNKVIAAVNTLMELVPVMTEELETVYNKILVAMDKTMAAGETIDAFLNSIKDEFDSIVNGAEELVGIQAEKLAAIREAIASCQEKINTVISENRPALEQGLKNTYADLEALILHKIEGTKQWLLNNQDDPRVVAVAMAYLYCVENGYVQQAKDLIKTYTQLVNAEIGKLEVELEKAEQLLNVELKKAERELRDRLTALKAELADIEAQLLNAVDAETRAALEKAKAELEAQIVIVEVKLEQLEAKAQQLAAYIETVRAAICQTKLALQDVIDAAAVVGDDLVALWNALCNLSLELRELGCAVGTLADATVNELCQLLEYCGIVADELIDLLETLPAYAKLLKDAADMVTDVENWKALAEQVKAAVNNLVEKLSGLLSEEQICEFLKYLVEKYGPEVAEQLLDMLTYLFLEYGHDVAVAFYYFLYDHPYEVIAFFQEYGDEIADLIIEYGPVVLAIIGYALSIYGEDLAAYIIENHKAILDGIIYWGDIHNDKMMALLQVYAEALGWCDVVRDQIAEIEKNIAEMEQAIRDEIARVEAQLEELNRQLQELMAQLENAAEELKAQIEAQIEAVKAMIEELKAQLEELNAKLMAAIEEAKAAIEALKAALQEALEKGLTELENLKKAALELNEKIQNLICAAKNAALEELNDAIAALEKALAELDEAICHLVGEIYEKLKAALYELGLYLIDEMVEAIKKYAPELADQIYWYLYNNAETVIAFFMEYGHYLMDLLNEYGMEALAVIAYMLYMFGEEIAAFFVENWELLIATIIEWARIHGENFINLLQVYAEALGLCDMVRQQIQALQDMLECLKQQLQDLKQQLENACDELKAQIEKQIAAVEEKIAQIEEALRELIAQLEELYQQIIDIAEAIKDVIDAMKELHDIIAGKVEGSIQEALKALEDAMDKLAEFIDIVEDVIDAIEAFIEYLQDLKEELCQIIQQIEALIEQIENAIIEMNERVEEILAELEQSIEDMKQTLEQIQAAVEEMIDCAEQKLSELKACLEALIAEIRAAVEALKAKVQELFNNTLYADYIVSKDSYYVSLGDSTTTGIATGDPAYGNFGYMTKVPNSFPYKLAQELGLDVDTQFAQLAMAGLRPTDLRYILDENFQPDDYALNRNNDRINAYAGGIDQMRADYLAELAKADLVTISIGSCNFNDFVMTQIKGELAEYLNQELAFWLNNPYFGPMLRDGISEYVDLDSTTYEMDWVNYIGEDGVKALNETLAVLRENVIANGVNEVITIDLGETFGLSVPAGTIVVNIPAADLVVYMAECYLYAYVTFAMDYAAAYDLVRQAAPNATLVIVGMYNPADNLVINVGDMALPIGDLYTGFATAINLHHITYALEAENTIYVDIPNTESINDQVLSEIGTEFDLMDYIMYNLETAPDFHASADGHTYIKDEIMDQLNVTMYGLLGDINLDGRVNGSDMNLLYRYIMEDVELTGLQLYVANLNQDGRVNGSDLCMLYRYIMEDETLAWEPSLARG